MATTLTNLQTSFSRRLAEDSVPATNGQEYARRLQFLNEGYRSILRKHYWWWTEKSDTFDSVADQTSYTVAQGFPSDIRNSQILELRFNGTLYQPVQQSIALNLESASAGLSQRYYVFDKKLWPVAPFASTVTDGIAIKYYKISTPLSSGSDTVDIPDEYADILVAFALGRQQSINSKRGSAADAYDEFNEIYKEMEKEQNDYLFANKSDSTDVTALYP